MPSDKTRSFVVSPAASAVIDGLAGGELNYSGALSTIAERFDEVVRRHLPGLTAEEWTMVTHSLRNVMRQPWMVGAVEQAIEPPAVADRVASLTFAEKVSLVTTVERYWAAKARGEDARPPGSDDARRMQPADRQ